MERRTEDIARQDIRVFDGKADIFFDSFTQDVYHELGVDVWVMACKSMFGFWQRALIDDIRIWYSACHDNIT